MEDAKTWLEKFKQESKEDNVELKTELINSHRPVDYVILEYAEKNNINLIVVGTRGRSGFEIITWKYCIFSSNLCSLPCISSKVIGRLRIKGEWDK
jgi:Universal stress protein family